MTRIGPRTAITLTLASVAAMVMFCWPLLLTPPAGAEQVTPPFLFLALLPLVVVVVLAEMSEGGMDAKTLALLGVLTAVNGALRQLGAAPIVEMPITPERVLRALGFNV